MSLEPETVRWLLIGAVALVRLATTAIELLNLSVKRFDLDPRLGEHYSAETYERSVRYKQDNARLGLLSSGLVTLATLGLILFGGFGWLEAVLAKAAGSGFPRLLLYFGILFGVQELMGVPFELYATFRIEQRYGFNRMTPGLWVADKAKSLLIGAILGSLALFGLLKFIDFLGSWFWLAFAGTGFAFVVLMNVFYTSLIVPLFNKLSPLPEGEVKAAIEEYARKTGFPLAGIFVMNASKRSTKLNAYFSGLGARKKIVLFDTLLEKATAGEIVGVLAHEVGHYRKRHVLFRLFNAGAQLFLMSWLFSLCIGSESLALALGGASASVALSLTGFALLFSPASMLIGFATNALSRRNEFEADRFAAETFSGPHLSSALAKLSVENLSNLYPHPAYVAAHYSHPPVLKRLDALAAVGDGPGIAL